MLLLVLCNLNLSITSLTVSFFIFPCVKSFHPNIKQLFYAVYFLRFGEQNWTSVIPDVDAPWFLRGLNIFSVLFFIPLLHDANILQDL